MYIYPAGPHVKPSRVLDAPAAALRVSERGIYTGCKAFSNFPTAINRKPSFTLPRRPFPSIPSPRLCSPRRLVFLTVTCGPGPHRGTGGTSQDVRGAGAARRRRRRRRRRRQRGRRERRHHRLGRGGDREPQCGPLCRAPGRAAAGCLRAPAEAPALVPAAAPVTVARPRPARAGRSCRRRRRRTSSGTQTRQGAALGPPPRPQRRHQGGGEWEAATASARARPRPPAAALLSPATASPLEIDGGRGCGLMSLGASNSA